MIITTLILTFFLVVATGPDGKEWYERRKALKSRPMAKLLPFPYPKGHPRRI